MKKTYVAPEMESLAIRTNERFTAACGYIALPLDGSRDPVYNDGCHIDDGWYQVFPSNS